MHKFCAVCGNLLIIDSSDVVNNLACRSCPYRFPIHERMTESKVFERKKVDDVLGGADAWKNVDSIEAVCPKCDHRRAFYMQIQIRSADEPSSLFFRCCNSECNFQWREG